MTKRQSLKEHQFGYGRPDERCHFEERTTRSQFNGELQPRWQGTDKGQW